MSLKNLIRKKYTRYAIKVVTDRSMPDITGLKPVQKKILYAMYLKKLFPSSPLKKCAVAVGDVLGAYHPHGDSSVYGALARMGQEWNNNYPLIDFGGNKGNISGENPAAMRYTESRLSSYAMLMLDGLNKDTVDWMPSPVDPEIKMPRMLPSRFPNLLVNGSTGIGVGINTGLPPHNLQDVMKTIQAYIDNKNISCEELADIIVSPEFPTGAMITNKSKLKDMYVTGKGSVAQRAKYEVSKNGKEIIITNVPYMTAVGTVVEKIEELITDDKLEGVKRVLNESGVAKSRIVLELKPKADTEAIMKILFAKTRLKNNFLVRMNILVDGKPEKRNLKSLVRDYVNHVKTVNKREVEFEKRKLVDQLHTVEGFLIVLNGIDKAIEIIRGSETKEQAKISLMEHFKITEIQATKVLNMTLGRLTKMSKVELLEEEVTLKNDIAQKTEFLNSEDLQYEKIKLQMDGYKKTSGRITEVVDIVESSSGEVNTESGILMLTTDGKMSFNVGEINLKKGQEIKKAIRCNGDDMIAVFDKNGMMIRCLACTFSAETLPISPSFICKIEEGGFIYFATKNGKQKIVPASEYIVKRVAKKPTIGTKLKEEDELVCAESINGNVLVISSKNGKGDFYDISKLNKSTKNALGATILNLDDGDEVISASGTNVEKNENSVLITFRSDGKIRQSRTNIDISSLKNANSKGKILHKTDDKNTLVASSFVNELENCLTSIGEVVSINAIPEMGLGTQGRKLEDVKGKPVSFV